MKYKRCPMCDGELGDRWCMKRKLQQFCYDDECGWKAEERIPEKIAVTNTKTCHVDSFSGWDYTIYDKYGHTMVLSRTYNSRDAAIKEMNRELLRGETDENGGPYTGVLFNTPCQVTVVGEMFKAEKGEVKKVK